MVVILFLIIFNFIILLLILLRIYELKKFYSIGILPHYHETFSLFINADSIQRKKRVITDTYWIPLGYMPKDFWTLVKCSKLIKGGLFIILINTVLILLSLALKYSFFALLGYYINH